MDVRGVRRISPGFFGGTWGTWFGRVRFSGISALALIHPEDREFLHDTTPLFLWGPSSGGVVDYSLQVTSGDIDTGPFDLDVVTADVTQYQVQPGEAFSAGTYSWHVIAKDAGAINTASSVTRTFTIGVHPEHPPDQAPSQGRVSTASQAASFSRPCPAISPELG